TALRAGHRAAGAWPRQQGTATHRGKSGTTTAIADLREALAMTRYLLPLLLLLGGCAGDPAHEFYQLPPAAAAQVQPAQGTAVLLGRLRLADYLQRASIVQRHSEHRLHLSADPRWAGSVQGDNGRPLLSTLGNRLHSGNLA